MHRSAASSVDAHWSRRVHNRRGATLVAVGVLLVSAAGCGTRPGAAGGFYYVDGFGSSRFSPIDGASTDAIDGVGAPQDGAVKNDDVVQPDVLVTSDASVDVGKQPDASMPDADTPDVGPPDAGTPDVGTPDAGTPDAGTPDVGMPDAGTGAVALTAGALIISEIHADPSAVTDAKGEWFEVINVSGQTIHLGGLQIADKTYTHTVLNGQKYIIAPGGYFVFGINVNTASNGGVKVGYAYKKVTLNNGGDLLALRVGVTVVDEISYAVGSGGWPAKDPGKSIQLDANKTTVALHTAGTAWCRAQTTFGAGDFGTPGTPNTTCP